MKNFEARAFVKQKIKEIQASVKDKKIIVAASGGLESAVCSLLAHKAVGGNAVHLHLDNGLMRNGDSANLTEFLGKHGIELQVWDVREKFLEAMGNNTDPEEKRKIFRDVFYKTFGQALKSYSADYLLQGTILPDIIETQKGIKTHPHVLQQAGISPQIYGLLILEPLRELLKTQALSAARTLEVPPRILKSFPFPAPGFAVRITGEITPEKIDKIRAATEIVEDEFKRTNVYQAFPVLLADKTAGIAGDKKTIGSTLVLRLVESKDSLTAKPYKIPWPKLEGVEKRLLKEIPGIVKILLDITPKPPSTIEFI